MPGRSCSTKSPACRAITRPAPKPPCSKPKCPRLRRASAPGARWSNSAPARPPRPRSCSAQSILPPTSRSIFRAIICKASAAVLDKDFHDTPGPSGGRRFHGPDHAPARNRGPAQAGLLPRLDDRQSGPRNRDQFAPPLARPARGRIAAADRHGPGQAGRAAARRLRRPRRRHRRLQLEPARADQSGIGRQHSGRCLRPPGPLERDAQPDRDAPCRDPRRRFHRRRPAIPLRPRRRASTPRTATNMARAAAACCCFPAAGPRSPNGPTPTAISP